MLLPSQMPLPRFYRMLSACGTQLEKLGVPLTRMDAQSLYQAVERATGLSDFGDPYHREGLEVLLHSIDKDADLHFFGRFITRMVLINYMTQRALFVEAQKRSPDIFRAELNAPFIVTGIPRSGTTFLHRMIAADPKNTGVPFWRLFRPFPTFAKKDTRQSTARFELKFRRPIYPEMDTKHFIREDQEEECIWMSSRIIQMHRDPTACVTSLSSLFYSTHRSVTNDLNPQRLGEINRRMFTYYLKVNRDARARLGENGSVLDVDYTQLVKNPIETVKSIYAHFAVPWSDAYEERLQSFVNRQPKDKYGKHHYTPEQFGQSARELDAHFAALM